MSIAQSTTTKFPAVGQPGGLSHHPAQVVTSKVVDETNGINPGLVVVPSATKPEQHVSLPEALAADPDFFVTTDAALGDASGTSFSGAGFTGAYTAGQVLNPPRNVTLVLGSDANWDATTATVVGFDADFNRITESLSIPNGGNATVAGQKFFSVVESVTIPVQSGDAPGTIGLGTEAGPLKGAVALLNLTKENLFVSGTADTVEPFADGQALSVLEKGQCLVTCENACTAGGQVYVRLVTAGAEVLGAIRSNADGSAGAPDCVPLHGFKFRQTLSAGGTVLISNLA